MVRVVKLFFFGFIIQSTFSYADSPVLKDEAQKEFKRTRVNSDQVLKAWADEAKKDVQVKVEELKKAGLSPAAIASANAALASLQDPAFGARVLETLKKVDRKDWQEVLKDLAALMKQKNLSLEDLAKNPKIIRDYILSISEKEKAFWEQRAKLAAQIPVTETPADLSVPQGSFEDALKLMKALSSFIKVQNVEADPNNLLIRYFMAP
jgi:hypothetical protein